MRAKTVPSKWMRREGLRLDVGPYMSGALEAQVRLEELSARKDSLESVTLGLVNAGRIKRLWVQDPEYGVPFLSSTDILKADISQIRLIAKSAVTANPKLTIREGWTLITRAGSIGRMAYARPDMDGLACTEDVLRVIPNPAQIPSGYLYAYLSSKFGLPLVVSGTYGAIIQHIEPRHIADLPVPRLGEALEREVHELVQESAHNLSRHRELLEKATDLLFESTGVWNPNRHEWFSDLSDRAFAISSTELSIMRAWNHSRRAKRIRDEVEAGPHDLLGDVTEFEWLRWRKLFKRIDADPEHGVEVITQKPLFQLFPKGRWLSRSYLLNHSDKYIVPDETILIAKQGTFGENELYCRCEAVTGSRMLRRAYSDHCMRIVAKRDCIDPAYLFAFLRSNAAFRVLRALSEGAKQQDLHWRTVPSVPVPRCDAAIESTIAGLVREGWSSRTAGVEGFIEATQMVESAIEEAT